MNTDARRKASATYHAKRTEGGLKKVTLWLSPEAREALEALKQSHGSKDAAADAAIIAAKGGAKPFPSVDGLHPRTAELVRTFAIALAGKLHAAEAKYGYSDGWETEDWEADCRAQLQAHVFKGDPLDVAAYAAFCWSRGWSTWEDPTAKVAP